MLHARIEVAQILDSFQVRAVIHEFSPGSDPVIWESINSTFPLPAFLENADALTITLELIRLWSEKTISD